MRKLTIVFCLLVIILAAGPTQANQPNLSGTGNQQTGDSATIDRAFEALAALNDYQSLRYAFVLESVTVLSGVINESADVSYAAEGAIIQTATGPTERQQVAADFNLNETFADTLRAELRVVDGMVYVNSAYDGDTAALGPVPEGWYAVATPARLERYPGLEALNVRARLQPGTTGPADLLLGYPLADLRQMVDDNLRGVAVEPETLDDGTQTERIDITLGKEALRALNIFNPNPDDPGQMAVYERIGPEPVVMSIWLDEDGQLAGYGYDSAFLLENEELAPGAVLSVDARDNSFLRISDINADLEAISAPPEAAPVMATAVPEGELPWWNDRVFYEVFVRSFYDSDGDGIGDLPGLIEKLDYLNDGDPSTSDDLGITGIWLMPVAQSPSYHGYDVTDYTTIEEDYGTNEDFKAFMAAAHERGIAVIVDLVLNHTSREHPWFVAAREGDSEFEDYYIWAEEDPGFRGPWGQPVWHPADGRYYFGLFWEGMPDLNYNNPAVTEDMLDITEFWLEEMGADGFRLDAIRHLYEEGPVMENVPETLTWLEEFNAFVHEVQPDALTVGEIWDETAEVVPYVGERVDIAFEFEQAEAILYSLQRGHHAPLTHLQANVLTSYPPGQYAAFLTNHDQNRVMSQLEENEPAATVAATLLLTNPGVPFIYYGEEIGMTGTKPDERIRTPMQWDDSRIHGGFSDTSPWQLMAHGYRSRHVAGMEDDPASLLNHYRGLVHLRNEHPALRTGGMAMVESSDPRLYAFVRFAEEGEALLVLVNLSDEVVTDYELRLAEGPLGDGDIAPEIVFGGEGALSVPERNSAGGFADYAPVDEVAAYRSLIIQLR